MRSPLGWVSLGSCQESQFISTIWDQLGVSISVQETANLGPWDCHLGFMGLPFGVHGTAVWGPCDRHLGSVGLPFRVHGTAI